MAKGKRYGTGGKARAPKKSKKDDPPAHDDAPADDDGAAGPDKNVGDPADDKSDHDDGEKSDHDDGDKSDHDGGEDGEDRDDGEDGGEGNDDAEEGAVASVALRGMTRKKAGDTFTLAQESDMAQWFEDNPIFYDQSLSEFKFTARNRKLAEEKGKEMGVTGAELLIWFKSQRTIFGRLKKKKSRDGAKPKTARQEWVMRAFSFLGAHVVIRSERRQLGSIPVPDEEDQEDQEDQEEDPIQTQVSQVSQVSRQPTPVRVPVSPGPSPSPNPSLEVQVWSPLCRR